MKTNLFLFLGMALLLSSCSVRTIYQVVNTKSDNLNSEYVFENEDVKCSYDLWNTDGGAPYSFKLFNKSDKPIYLDWSKSSFIVNGASYDYYQETTVTESKTVAKSASSIFKNNQALSANSSTIQMSATQSYKQKKVQYIPAQSFVEYRLNSSMLRMLSGCDYKLKGTEKIKEFSFEKNNTPYVFRNHLSYAFSENATEQKVIDSEFWVNQMYLMNEKTFMGDKKVLETCDKKLLTTPTYTYSYPYKKKNSYFFSKGEKGSAAGAVLGVLGGILLVIVLVAAT